MNLYIINTNLTFDQATYLLKHLTPYNGQVCDIIEITNSNVKNIKSGYLSKLTIGKLRHQLNKDIMYYIYHDFDENDVIYYLVQTLQIQVKDIIHDICQNNAYRSLKVYLDQGVNANIQDNSGWTPLHLACYWNNVESVKLLLDNEANVNIQDNDSLTPLQLAQKSNSTKCIKILQVFKNE